MRAFQTVKVHPGTPREMGMQYGRQARGKIPAGLVYDLEDAAHICASPPCEGEFVRYAL